MYNLRAGMQIHQFDVPQACGGAPIEPSKPFTSLAEFKTFCDDWVNQPIWHNAYRGEYCSACGYREKSRYHKKQGYINTCLPQTLKCENIQQELNNRGLRIC